MAVVGVLGLQGDFAEHCELLSRLGVSTRIVKRPAHLAGLDGLVLPGGESTTLSLLLRSAGLTDRLAGLIAEGMPVLGTCAGMILLASKVLDGRPDQVSFGAIDLAVRRNAYGSQVDSFECDLKISGWDQPLRGIFIRAPAVEEVGPDVEVLASLPPGTRRPAGEPVLCRQGTVVVASFHPEVAGDPRVHQIFLEAVGS